MPIAVALVRINEHNCEDAIDLIASSIESVEKIPDEVVDQGAIELDRIGQNDHMYYVYMSKKPFELHEFWTVVGNASKYNENWEPVVQYGVWACMYELEIPKFNKKSQNLPSVILTRGIDFATCGTQFRCESKRASTEGFDPDLFDGIFDEYRGKRHKNKKNKHNLLNLDKNFNILDKYSIRGGTNKHIIDLPVKPVKKKLRRCLVELTPINPAPRSDAKSALLDGCPVILWDAIDSAVKNPYDIDYSDYE